MVEEEEEEEAEVEVELWSVESGRAGGAGGKRERAILRLLGPETPVPPSLETGYPARKAQQSKGEHAVFCTGTWCYPICPADRKVTAPVFVDHRPPAIPVPPASSAGPVRS